MQQRDFYDPLWHIPHYYGDVVRRLFLGVAAVMLLASPLYGANIGNELPFELAGAVVLVILAAFTSPRVLWVMLANSIIAAIGFMVYEIWAITNYAAISSLAFALRQLIALMLLFALYNAAKTARAMMLGQVGVAETEDDLGSSSKTDLGDDEQGDLFFGDPGGVDGTADDGM